MSEIHNRMQDCTERRLVDAVVFRQAVDQMVEAAEARIVAWLRREYRKLAKDKDFAGALALQEAAIAIERREHEETAGG